jgi:hypothetical protein
MSMREEFEKWAEREGYRIDRFQSRPEHYQNTYTSLAFSVWQAAYAAGLRRAAEVCREVGREHGEHPEWATTCAAAIEQEIECPS